MEIPIVVKMKSLRAARHQAAQDAQQAHLSAKAEIFGNANCTIQASLLQHGDPPLILIARLQTEYASQQAQLTQNA